MEERGELCGPESMAYTQRWKRTREKKAPHRNVESKFAAPFFSIECPVSHQIDMDSRIRAAAAVTGFLD